MVVSARLAPVGIVVVESGVAGVLVAVVVDGAVAELVPPLLESV